MTKHDNRNKGNELGALRQAIIDNTKGDLFWLGEILLAELEKETGFNGEPCPSCAGFGQRGGVICGKCGGTARARTDGEDQGR